MPNLRYLIPLIAFIAAMAAALLACGSEPTVAPTTQPTATTASQPTLAPATATPVPASPTAMPDEPAATPPPAASAPVATAAPTAAPEPTPPPSTSTPAPTSTPGPVTVVSSDGNEVTFETPPERIVVYDGAAVEMLFAIGQGHRIVGTHEYVTYPPEETAAITKVGDAFNMNIEAVVALEPDLVFVFYDTFNADLERTGLKVLYIRSLSHGFTEVADQIRMWGEITGGTEAAGKLADDFDARVAAVREKMESVEEAQTIYSHGFGWWTPGSKTLVNDVFEMLKLQNIADFEGYQQISPEVVVAANPDIIMGTPADVTGEAALAGIQAVEDGRIFTFSGDSSFSVAGPRFMDAVEEMAAWVYPELFP